MELYKRRNGIEQHLSSCGVSVKGVDWSENIVDSWMVRVHA